MLLAVTVAAFLSFSTTNVHSDVLLIPPALLLLGAALSGEPNAPNAFQVLLLEALRSAPALLLPLLAFAIGIVGNAIQQTDYAILLLLALTVFINPWLRLSPEAYPPRLSFKETLSFSHYG